MTNTDATIADLQDKIRVLELDRDYWRDQHDLVMQDWRVDIEAWSAERADLTALHNAGREVLAATFSATPSPRRTLSARKRPRRNVRRDRQVSARLTEGMRRTRPDAIAVFVGTENLR